MTGNRSMAHGLTNGLRRYDGKSKHDRCSHEAGAARKVNRKASKSLNPLQTSIAVSYYCWRQEKRKQAQRVKAEG